MPFCEPTLSNFSNRHSTKPGGTIPDASGCDGTKVLQGAEPLLHLPCPKSSTCGGDKQGGQWDPPVRLPLPPVRLDARLPPTWPQNCVGHGRHSTQAVSGGCSNATRAWFTAAGGVPWVDSNEPGPEVTPPINCPCDAILVDGFTSEGGGAVHWQLLEVPLLENEVVFFSAADSEETFTH